MIFRSLFHPALILFILFTIFGRSDSFAFWEDDLLYEGECFHRVVGVVFRDVPFEDVCQKVELFGHPDLDDDGEVRVFVQKTVHLGILPDDVTAAAAEIAKWQDKVDLFLTTGGVSVGKKDIMHGVVAEIGKRLFWRVCMKPGGPAIAYTFGKTLGIALSGCSDAKADFLGTWSLENGSGITLESSSIELIKSLGYDISLALDENGSGTFDLAGKKYNITWEAKSPTEGTIDVEGGVSGTLSLVEGKLIIESGDGSTMTFFKTDSGPEK